VLVGLLGREFSAGGFAMFSIDSHGELGTMMFHRKRSHLVIFSKATKLDLCEWLWLQSVQIENPHKLYMRWLGPESLVSRIKIDRTILIKALGQPYLKKRTGWVAVFRIESMQHIS
jgi:hypothetical protein